MSFGPMVVLTCMRTDELIAAEPCLETEGRSETTEGRLETGETASAPDPGKQDAIVAAAVAGDESAFAVLVERYRRELHVHCYRMVGSFDEAEDLVQEVFLRAWRGRTGFAGRSSFRGWLYRIATNLCLDVLKRNSRRIAVDPAAELPTTSRTPWLQPYPDTLLDEVASPGAEPDSMVIAKETIELAFLAAIQLLPPRARAAFILRDVLGWSANETAAILDGSVASANSALQRARATVQKRWPGGRLNWAPATDPSDTERQLLQRYIEAHERADANAVIELLHEHARLSITHLDHWAGRGAVADALKEGMCSLGDWQMVPTRANRQPAAAAYLRRFADSTYRAFALTLLRVEDGAIVDITAFEDAALFRAFGLPPTLE